MKCIFVLLMVIPFLFAAQVILLDLTPEEAQKYIAGRSLDLAYAKLLEEAPLSQYAGQQDFYHEGRLIDNLDGYVHKQYEANQFHGQDGLGRSMFGYSDWNQGRLEARNANGEIRGSYQFVDPNGENVVVNYWSDSLGYHQMDNRPKTVLESVTDTPEVVAAKLAHQKAWEAAAKAAAENPDPLSDTYNQNELDGGQSKITEIFSDKEYNPAEDSSPIEDESRQEEQIRKAREEELAEKSGPPRGFFYSIDYPVRLLSEVESSQKVKRSDYHSFVDVRLAPEDLESDVFGTPKEKRNDQIALESSDSEPSKVEVVTAEKSHPVASNEKVLIVDAVQATELPALADKVESFETKQPETDLVPPKVTLKPIEKNELSSELEKIITEQTPSLLDILSDRISTDDKLSSTDEKIDDQPIAGEKSEMEPNQVQKLESEPQAQLIPVEIRIEGEPESNVKSAADIEGELKRLVSDVDAVDAVHDTQVHPKQVIDV